MTSEQAELERCDIQGRVAWAAAVRPALNDLILNLRYLGKKQVSPQDRPCMDEADRLIEVLHEKLEEATEDYFESLGPASTMGSQTPQPTFGYFRNAIRRLKKEIGYLRFDRARQGDSDWSKWLREAACLRPAFRELADFLRLAEEYGYDLQSVASEYSKSRSDDDIAHDHAASDPLASPGDKPLGEGGSAAEGDRNSLEAHREKEWERACSVLSKRKTTLANALRRTSHGMSYETMSDIPGAFTRDDVSTEAAQRAVDLINRKWATLQPLTGWTIATVSSEGMRPVLRRAVWKKNGQ